MKLFLHASVALALALSNQLLAQNRIDNTRGADPGVDYAKLTKYGPWDDRNYILTRADLSLLPPGDQYVNGVPAFYKVEYRKQTPEMAGYPLYPRSMRQSFHHYKDGLLVDGVFIDAHEGGKVFERVLGVNPIITDQPISAMGNVNELTIEQNPANPLRIIAGGNGVGQVQFFSADGGASWSSATGFSATCCDASLEWSVDGSVAYAATLGSGVGPGFRASVYRSTDQGQSWTGRINVSLGSSDKEWIHVDRAASSPHSDNLYMSWHQGNVQQFARSTDKALSWSTPIAFSTAPRGIGSDLTTDRQGRLYYFYPATAGSNAACTANSIRLLRSDNGGVSFVNPASSKVVDICGSFEASIPSMETRKAFVYTSVDTDTSTGPYSNRIYVAYTDLVAPTVFPYSVNATAQNHVGVEVVYSDNQGATWSAPRSPHITSDAATVDRFHPWLDVDANGVVHIGYYDTKNSVGRSGVDFYYSFSTDGGATWAEPARLSSQDSQNIASDIEWGDYNGLSVNLQQDRILSVWTDNRVTAGTPQPRGYVGRIENTSDVPQFNAIIAPGEAAKSLCALSLPTVGAPFVVNLTAQNGFASPVNVAVSSSLPAGMALNLSANTLTPPGSIRATPTVGTGITAGLKQIELQSSSGSQLRNTALSLNIVTVPPVAPSLAAPANNAVAIVTTPNFSWATVPQAENYVFELASDAAFTTIIQRSAVVDTSIASVAALATNTRYFWRVSALNACPVPSVAGEFRDGFEDATGGSARSNVFSFVTAGSPGDCPAGTTQSLIYSENMDGGAAGWVASAGGGATPVFALSNASAQSGSAYRGIAPTVDADHRLESPTITIPAGAGTRELVFAQRVGLEVDTATSCFDAGILEISSNGGAYTQITTGITGLGYTGAVSTDNTTLGGRQAWCGNGASYATTAVDLTSFAGQAIKLRWRMGSDTGTSEAVGWNIDNVRVQSCQ
jgi:hypothetical protein